MSLDERSWNHLLCTHQDLGKSFLSYIFIKSIVVQLLLFLLMFIPNVLSHVFLKGGCHPFGSLIKIPFLGLRGQNGICKLQSNSFQSPKLSTRVHRRVPPKILFRKTPSTVQDIVTCPGVPVRDIRLKSILLSVTKSHIGGVVAFFRGQLFLICKKVAFGVSGGLVAPLA